MSGKRPWNDAVTEPKTAIPSAHLHSGVNLLEVGGLGGDLEGVGVIVVGEVDVAGEDSQLVEDPE